MVAFTTLRPLASCLGYTPWLAPSEGSAQLANKDTENALRQLWALSAGLDQAMATILSIPLEARQLIFHDLFQDANVVVSRNLNGKGGKLEWLLKIVKGFDDVVLYTCSQLYEEARATIPFFLHMGLDYADTGGLSSAITSYYCSFKRPTVATPLGPVQVLSLVFAL